MKPEKLFEYQKKLPKRPAVEETARKERDQKSKEDANQVSKINDHNEDKYFPEHKEP